MNETQRNSSTSTSPPLPIRLRYRVRFAKCGLLRWTSHRDLARLWERIVRRANFKLSMTEGFHPKPRIGFPSALALGVIGLEEVVELQLAETLHPQEVLDRLLADQQPGLEIRSVSLLPDGFGTAQLKESHYEITVVGDQDDSQIQSSIDQLTSRDVVTVSRKNKSIEINVADQILSLQATNHSLHLVLAASEAATLRPADVLDLLGFGDWIEQGSTITRTRVILAREFESQDPAAVAVTDRTPANDHPQWENATTTE